MGICGAGMGSFAGLLQAAGHRVRGSDANAYPPMSEKLASWGVEVRRGYHPDNLEPPVDRVIIGNVIRRTNPEAQAVLERNIPYTSFPAALSEMFLARRHSVVVTGTHGKTTTASMAAWLLHTANLDPSMLVGGVVEGFGEGFRLGRGPHFVVEGDEYDTAFFDKGPKFLHYRPRTAVVTSLEYDHADIYDSVAAIEARFHEFVGLVPKDGQIYGCASAPRVMERIAAARSRVQTYTARSDFRADWTAQDIQHGPDGVRFLVFRRRVRVGRFFLPMSGLHNVENALAAIAVALGLGATVGETQEGLGTYQGVRRRQTVRATVDGVRIIDDFAHHPTAVRETLAGLRARFADGRLFAVFEPRSATSSRRVFQKEFARAFSDATEVLIAQVGRPELADTERLDTDALAHDIERAGTPARFIPTADEIVAHLVERARPADTLVFMSNGGFSDIYSKMEDALRKRGGQFAKT